MCQLFDKSFYWNEKNSVNKCIFFLKSHSNPNWHMLVRLSINFYGISKFPFICYFLKVVLSTMWSVCIPPLTCCFWLFAHPTSHFTRCPMLPFLDSPKTPGTEPHLGFPSLPFYYLPASAMKLWKSFLEGNVIKFLPVITEDPYSVILSGCLETQRFN